MKMSNNKEVQHENDRHTEKYALTPDQLSLIGAYDSFFELFLQINEIYDRVEQQITDKEKEKFDYGFWTIDHLAKNQRRKLIDPIILHYADILIPPSFLLEIMEQADKAFQKSDHTTFSMYYFGPPKIGGSEVQRVSFQRFLCRIEDVIIRRVMRSELAKDADLPNIAHIVNAHILQAIGERKNDIEQGSVDLLRVSPSATYVFNRLQAVKCYRENHPVIPSLYVARRTGAKGVVNLPIHYCKQCNKCFIGQYTLNQYKSVYGDFIIRILRESPIGFDFSGFSLESRLHQLGYNVEAGKMKDATRHDLLISLIESGELSYIEICATIEQNIKLFEKSPKHQIAVIKWKQDLKFIGNYISEALAQEGTNHG